MLGFRKVTVIVTQLALVAAFALAPAGAKTNGDRERINAQEMKEWLTYLSSDEFEGRATFTEGLGLAAGYMAGLLKSWGVKPGGPNGSYFQRVAVLGVKSDNRSTVTVEANGQTRTFKNKEGISFPANSGGKRAFTADQIEFLGYGLNAPAINHNDFAGKQVKGKVVVYLGGFKVAFCHRAIGRDCDHRPRRRLCGRSRGQPDDRAGTASRAGFHNRSAAR